jgi:NTE family protein
MTHAPPKISGLGIALGSGAARGLAHIGVLKVLEEKSIPVDALAGTSIGALIGALYAAGVPVTQMEQVALEIDWRSMAKLLDPVIPFSGLTDGRKLNTFIKDLLPVRTFEELNCPLAVTATDINTGEAVVIKQGDLLEALRASLAFPGIFSPAIFGQRVLVDGGLCKPLPTDVVRDMGTNKVIGICTIPKVDKNTPETFLARRENDREPGKWKDLFNASRIEQAFRTAIGQEFNGDNNADADVRPPNIFKVCAQSVAIMENVINDLQTNQCPDDLILRPQLDGITLLEFYRAEEIIAAGEAAARDSLSQIEYLLRPA